VIILFYKVAKLFIYFISRYEVHKVHKVRKVRKVCNPILMALFLNKMIKYMF